MADVTDAAGRQPSRGRAVSTDAGASGGRRPPLRLIAIVAVALSVALAGCANPGDAIGSEPTGSVATARVPGPTPTASEAAMPDFILTSTAFEPGGSIPTRFTCDGENVSPDLVWSGAPADTGSFVLLVDDPDANGFVHWIAYDLTGSESGGLPAGVSSSPDAPPQGTNGAGTVGWTGPCPPSGEHRYRFTLSALTAPLGLTGAPDAKALRDALAGATVLGSTTLEGRYRRGGGRRPGGTTAGGPRAGPAPTRLARGRSSSRRHGLAGPGGGPRAP